jgi:hypothetical protein
MVVQRKVDFSLPSRDSFALSKKKRTPLQIVEAWGYHEDKKASVFSERVRSKIMVASMIIKSVETHEAEL